MSEDVRIKLIAMVEHLERFGPQAKRPQVDTLKGSKIANLKERRAQSKEVRKHDETEDGRRENAGANEG